MPSVSDGSDELILAAVDFLCKGRWEISLLLSYAAVRIDPPVPHANLVSLEEARG